MIKLLTGYRAVSSFIPWKKKSLMWLSFSLPIITYHRVMAFKSMVTFARLQVQFFILKECNSWNVMNFIEFFFLVIYDISWTEWKYFNQASPWNGLISPEIPIIWQNSFFLPSPYTNDKASCKKHMFTSGTTVQYLRLAKTLQPTKEV